ncbi:MAG: leucine-rich repeat domain-containing protein [Prevotella sp.]|nr:leucine-rich repeat domain-containing protein [Prevotella sp.]
MKALYPIRMKHLFVLSFMLMSLLPSASITSLAAEASSPAPALLYDDAELDAAKQDLMNMIYECMKVLEDSQQMLSEKATSDEAPELYQQVDEIAKYLDHARYQLDQVASIEELKDLQMMVMDIRKRLEELRYQIEEFEAANVFTATTIEGVEMTFKVISEEDKTCQVGVGTNENRAVDKNVSGTLTIPEKANGYTVISIGSYAFRECKNLTNVVLPVGITSIGNRSFSNCTGLQYINFPEGLKSIGESCFHTCSSFREINIPASLTSIGYVAFASCGSVTSISVAEGNAVFDSRNNCNAILVTSSNQLFRGCRNTRIPEEIRSLAICSFDGCPISSIQLPPNLVSIGGWAFSGTGLEIVNIPEKVQNIGWKAFEGCANLEMVSLPSSVTFIDDYAFYNCPKLTNIRSFIQEPFKVPEHAFVNWDTQTRTDVPSEATLTVPYGTKALYEATEGWNKFANIVEMENNDDIIVFADANVKALCVENWDTNGDGELSYDEAAAVTDLGEVFSGNNDITSFDELQYFTGITSLAFYGCSSLKSIKFPASLTAIPSFSFRDCASLENIELTEYIKSIGEFAFADCTGLTSVNIPKNVESIGIAAFGWCNLDYITVDEANAIYQSPDGCNAVIDVRNDMLVVGTNHTVIPESVKIIGDRAFAGCEELPSVTLPSGLTAIYDWAFSSCTSLQEVFIPANVMSIKTNPFSRCNNLNRIVVDPANTTYDSRENCNGIIETSSNTLIAGIQATVIPNTVTTIGSYAYYNCRNLTSISIPSSVTRIADYAFGFNYSLTTITIPNSVKIIENSAFGLCI